MIDAEGAYGGETAIDDYEHSYEEYDGDEVIFDIDRFHKHDIDNITAALSILDAPEQCLRALRIIKGQPLLSEIEANE